MMYLFLLLSYLVIILMIMLGVSFIILLERKILGYIQVRKGPNKVGGLGILQSFSDAVKLFMKELIFPTKSLMLMFLIFPVFSLLLSVMFWLSFYNLLGMMNLCYGGLFVFFCLGLGIYILMGAGWSSNSNYSLLGAIRGVSQTISYEICLALIFLNLIYLCPSYNLMNFVEFQFFIFLIYLYLVVFFIWSTSILAELNRTPFDFSEGESELVSGFNIEYSSGGFILLFLSEYMSILFMSYLICLFFFGGPSGNLFLYNFVCLFVSFMVIVVRGILPRYRYDKLMSLSWSYFLPLVLLMMFFYFFFNWTSL